jgi:hypothetical protein
MQHSGRREVDIVVVTKWSILLVEVKNWSGCIKGQPTDATWHQQRRNGDIIEHPNPLLELVEKEKTTLKFLEVKATGIQPSSILSVLVMTNRQAELPESIQEHPRVIWQENFEDFLLSFIAGAESRESWLRYSLSCLTSWVGSAKMDAQQHAQVVSLLQDLSTWDAIHLVNGDCLKGDFVGLVATSGAVKPGRTQAVFNGNFRRSNCEALTFKHRVVKGWTSYVTGSTTTVVDVTRRVRKVSGTRFWGLQTTLQLPSGLGSHTQTVEGGPFEIQFQVVGRKKISLIPLEDCNEICLSKA